MIFLAGDIIIVVVVLTFGVYFFNFYRLFSLTHFHYAVFTNIYCSDVEERAREKKLCIISRFLCVFHLLTSLMTPHTCVCIETFNKKK